MKINEVFLSIQGEGRYTGFPMVFLRVAGCNLRCPFCDTKYAWEKEKGQEYNKEQILNLLINKFKKIKRICITGGEPFLQEDLVEVIQFLKQFGYWVMIETNGTIYKETEADWVVVSPKQDGKKIWNIGYNIVWKDMANEFKYVIAKLKDLDFIDRGITKDIWIVPVSNDFKVKDLIITFLENSGRKNWRLGWQLQKTLKN